MPIILASYSGDRNQEDHSLKPVKANTFRPYLKKKEKKIQHKTELVEWLTW
jgi:hypothetical protein